LVDITRAALSCAAVISLLDDVTIPFGQSAAGLGRPKRPGVESPAGEDDVSGLLGDEIDRAGDEEPWDAREDGGIHHPQVRRAVNAEIAAGNMTNAAPVERCGRIKLPN